jgi:hypothetical protein
VLFALSGSLVRQSSRLLESVAAAKTACAIELSSRALWRTHRATCKNLTLTDGSHPEMLLDEGQISYLTKSVRINILPLLQF